MRKFLIAIVFLSMCFISEAQKLSLPKVDTLTTVKDYEMEVIRECLWRYQKQIQLSYALNAGGVAAIAVGATMREKQANTLFAVGGTILLISYVNTMAAGNWLRMAGIRPIPSGIAIRIPSKK